MATAAAAVCALQTSNEFGHTTTGHQLGHFGYRKTKEANHQGLVTSTSYNRHRIMRTHSSSSRDSIRTILITRSKAQPHITLLLVSDDWTTGLSGIYIWKIWQCPTLKCFVRLQLQEASSETILASTLTAFLGDIEPSHTVARSP